MKSKRFISVTSVSLWFSLLLALGACVTAKPLAPTDFSATTTVSAEGLSLQLPKGYVRFTEGDAVFFRPDPPQRPSPGVMVWRQNNKKVMTVLDMAWMRVREKMSGEPEPIQNTMAGRKVLGFYSELSTHFIWIYALENKNTVWAIQIAAPVSWPDDKVLKFHDLVVGHVTIN